MATSLEPARPDKSDRPDRQDGNGWNDGGAADPAPLGGAPRLGSPDNAGLESGLRVDAGSPVGAAD